MARFQKTNFDAWLAAQKQRLAGGQNDSDTPDFCRIAGRHGFYRQSLYDPDDDGTLAVAFERIPMWQMLLRAQDLPQLKMTFEGWAHHNKIYVCAAVECGLIDSIEAIGLERDDSGVLQLIPQLSEDKDSTTDDTEPDKLELLSNAIASALTFYGKDRKNFSPSEVREIYTHAANYLRMTANDK